MTGVREGRAIWSVLAWLANILWWVWLVATLVVLGYFERLGLGVIQHGLGVSK